jgi:hypothetical protein
MGGWPNNPEAKRCIRVLQREFGWDYDTDIGSAAHRVGDLYCGGGCRIWVTGTGKNSARAIWSTARKCSHGHAPTRQHW